jgi:hypothetical protein
MFEVSTLLIGAVMMKRMRNKPFFFLLCVCAHFKYGTRSHDENKTFFMKDGNKNLIVHA